MTTTANTNAPITIDALIAKYAKDIAFVTEEAPATTAHDFATQVLEAAEILTEVGITIAEDMDQAATFIYAAIDAEPNEQKTLLKQAAAFLSLTGDAVDEYRDML